MAVPNVIVLTGYGINCDDETRFAFEKAGGHADIIHVNDIIDNPSIMDRYQIFSFPGGFSYGDDTGSGKALANRILNNLREEFLSFIERDTLMLGICNGFQVMVNLGIIPGLDGKLGSPRVALKHNNNSRFVCRWVDLEIEKGAPSVFVRGIERLHVPVAHGEGNLYAPPATLERIEAGRLVSMRYANPGGGRAMGEFPYNPNGSLNDIAAVCDSTGRLMGMMPHPERNILFTQRDDWTFLREKYRREGKDVPAEGEGLAIFRNAVEYFA